MESIEERIKIFTENVNKKNAESRCLEVATNGKVLFGKEKISLNGIIVGIKVPFDDLYSLDFYNGNCELITLDIDLEKDLNNEALRLRTSINTMNIKDKSTFDELQYTQDYIEGFSDGDKYRLCDEYNCSPSELAERMLDDNDIEDIIRDCISFDYNNNEYLSMWISSLDINSLEKDLDSDEKIIWLDNNYNLIKKLDIFSFNVFGENADLTVENMQAIAKIINEICQKGNVLDNVMQKLTENN